MIISAGSFAQALWNEASEKGSWTKVFDSGVDTSSSQALRAAVGPRPAFVFYETNEGRTFGGYTALGLIETPGGFYRHENDSFLFSIDNEIIYPVGRTDLATFHRSDYGPTFGGGHDIFVSQNLQGGYCNLGQTYFRNGAIGTITDEGCQEFTGSDRNGGADSLVIDRIEVFVLD
ncbi:MAG: TLD domain-containing protein [Pseudomonadota bacterium]